METGKNGSLLLQEVIQGFLDGLEDGVALDDGFELILVHVVIGYLQTLRVLSQVLGHPLPLRVTGGEVFEFFDQDLGGCEGEDGLQKQPILLVGGHLLEQLLEVLELFKEEIDLGMEVPGILVGHDVVQSDDLLVDAVEQRLVLL